MDEAFAPEYSLAVAAAQAHRHTFVVAEKKRVGGWRTGVIEAEADKPRGRGEITAALSLVA